MPNTQPFKRSLTKSYGLLKAVTKAFLSFCFIGPRSLCELSHRSSTLAFRNEQNGQSCWLYYCCGTPFWRRKWKFYSFCIAMPCQESRGPLGSSHVVVLVLWSTKKTRSSRVSRLSHNGGSSLSFAPLSSWKGWSESGVLRSVLRSSVKRDTKSTFLQNLHSLGTCCLADFRWRYFFRKLLSEPLLFTATCDMKYHQNMSVHR